jgi:tetratricopeptide (TPR) repeat protein
MLSWLYKGLARGVRRPGRLLLAGAVLLLAGGVVGVRWAAEWHLRAGERALEGHDEEAARAHLARSLALWPGQARAHFLAARAARRAHRYDEAAEHLRACRQRGYDAGALEVERLLTDLQRGDAMVVPELRKRVQEEDPHALEILEVLTQHYVDGYRLIQALACLNHYLECRPDDLPALLGRAFVWERFLYFADALRDYRRAVRSHPDSDRARLRLAATLLLVGTPDEAVGHYEQLAARQPESREVRLGLARCHLRLGRTEQGRRELEALLADHPEEVEALVERGRLALDEGQPVRAEGWLRRAVGLAPYHRAATYGLAQAVQRLGRRAEAEELRARLARIDADLRRMDQVSKAVMKAPDNAALRCEGGVLFLRNGEEAEGLRWLELALRLDPHCQAARKALQEHQRRPAPQPCAPTGGPR